VLRHGKVRRAKLYYMRGISEKASRLKERRLKEPPKKTAPAQEAEAVNPQPA
ncbi:MAG: 50S ribosomal protein L19, partial [Chloroflexota bacterium]